MLSLQEYIFQLEPGKVDSGKGKCSYDPKLNSVSALISEYGSFESHWPSQGGDEVCFGQCGRVRLWYILMQFIPFTTVSFQPGASFLILKLFKSFHVSNVIFSWQENMQD